MDVFQSASKNLCKIILFCCGASIVGFEDCRDCTVICDVWTIVFGRFLVVADDPELFDWWCVNEIRNKRARLAPKEKMGGKIWWNLGKDQKATDLITVFENLNYKYY